MADFDQWMQNPYTKVLQDSIANDYVPKPDLREAHELLGKMYAHLQRGEVRYVENLGGGIWTLPDRIGAWLEAQDAARTCGVPASHEPQQEKDHG